MQENAFIFGLSSEEVINYENNGGYNPQDIYFNDWELKRVVDQLMDGTYSHGNHEMYKNLYNSLLNTQSTDRADMYFILKDFRSYADAQRRVEEAYRDQQRWSRMAMLQTACSGKFSSDRTIEEYVSDIWKLEKVEVPSGQEEVRLSDQLRQYRKFFVCIVYDSLSGRDRTDPCCSAGKLHLSFNRYVYYRKTYGKRASMACFYPLCERLFSR